MKYTVKQKVVEEVILDLEDGCIIKLTQQNILKFSTERVSGYCEPTSFRAELLLSNEICYVFETMDMVLLENIRSLVEN